MKINEILTKFLIDKRKTVLMKPTLFVVSLAVAGFFAISPRSIAHGISVNHISAVDTQEGERQHWRYR